MNMHKIKGAWKVAADDLGIELVCPFNLTFSNAQIEFPLLIRDFGSKKGTIIASDFEPQVQNELTRNGFYFSVLSESYEDYSRNLFIDTLNDWQFYGEGSDRPNWYTGTPWTK